MEITYAVLIALNILALVAIATLSESIKKISVFKKYK